MWYIFFFSFYFSALAYINNSYICSYHTVNRTSFKILSHRCRFVFNRISHTLIELKTIVIDHSWKNFCTLILKWHTPSFFIRYRLSRTVFDFVSMATSILNWILCHHFQILFLKFPLHRKLNLLYNGNRSSRVIKHFKTQQHLVKNITEVPQITSSYGKSELPRIFMVTGFPCTFINSTLEGVFYFKVLNSKKLFLLHFHF